MDTESTKARGIYAKAVRTKASVLRMLNAKRLSPNTSGSIILNRSKTYGTPQV